MALGERMTAMAMRLNTGHVHFLASFALSKGLIYLMPLLVAAWASDRLYSAFEFGLAIGLQATAILFGAPLAGLTQLYLVEQERRIATPLLGMTAGGCAIAIVSALLLIAAGASLEWIFAAIVTGVVCFQNTASTWMRVRGRRSGIAWSDGLSLLLCGTVVLIATAVSGRDSAWGAAALLGGVTLAIAVGSFVALLRQAPADTAAIVRRAVRVGAPIMLSGALAIWLGVGGRILIGILAPDQVTAYSVAFRIAGLTLGLYQLVIAAAFARIYAAERGDGDRLMSLALCLVLGGAVLTSVAGPFLPDYVKFSVLEGGQLTAYRQLVGANVVQTFLWIGFALLQMRLARFDLAGKSILPIAAVTLGGIAIITAVGLAVTRDVVVLSWLIAAHAGAFFAVTAWLLAANGVAHTRTALVATGGTGVLILAGSVQL